MESEWKEERSFTCNKLASLKRPCYVKEGSFTFSANSERELWSFERFKRFWHPRIEDWNKERETYQKSILWIQSWRKTKLFWKMREIAWRGVRKVVTA